MRSPLTEVVVARLRALRSLGGGRDDVFLKAGGAAAASPSFLHCLASDWVDLDTHGALEPTVIHFRAGDAAGTSPFARTSLAARSGETASWVLAASPSPLDAELAAIDPALAVLAFGTGDMDQGPSPSSALPAFFEAMSDAVEHLMRAGVVPVVTGLTPRADDAVAARWVATYDAATRAIAERLQVPYLSLYQANRTLPAQGLDVDGVRDSVYREALQDRPCVFTAAALEHGYNQRNLLTLEWLHALRLSVLEGAPAPDAPPAALAGSGTRDDPWVIDALPFTHASDTTGGERLIDAYPGCAAAQDESGPERYYALAVPTDAPLRVVVLDRGTVDADVHLMTGGLDGGACVERHDRVVDRVVPAGAHHVVVDTYVGTGGELPGEYTLLVLPCDAGDPDC